jgi:putative OPT family oligopeptide transporter
MLVGAGFTLYRMRKSLGSGVSRAVSDVKKAAGQKGAQNRLDKDLDFRVVLAALAVVVVAMVGLYHLFTDNVGGAVVAALVMAVTGFFFAAVSGFLVGTIGSSNNPVSGLTVSTLIIAGLLMVAIGVSGKAGVGAVLGVAAVICTSSAVAGEMLQDLKVGHILGGTPWKMEVGDIVGVLFSAALLFFPLMILHQGDINMGGTGFGGKNLPAPQAGLMAMLSQGIVDQAMAWPLVIVGIVMGFGLILVQVRSPMLVAVGMYLPLETSFAIFVGGSICWLKDKLGERRGLNDAQKARVGNAGVLVAAGLIAGEALMGLCIAALAFFEIKLPAVFADPSWLVGIAVMVAVGAVMILVPLAKAGRPDEEAPPQAVM